MKPAFLTELFSNENGATDETANKRAKLEKNSACGDVEQRSDIKRANREKLAFMLYRRLRDSRWEVRDSTLEFVASLLKLVNQGESWLIAYFTKNDQLLISPYKFNTLTSRQVMRIKEIIDSRLLPRCTTKFSEQTYIEINWLVIAVRYENFYSNLRAKLVMASMVILSVKTHFPFQILVWEKFFTLQMLLT